MACPKGVGHAAARTSARIFPSRKNSAYGPASGLHFFLQCYDSDDIGFVPSKSNFMVFGKIHILQCMRMYFFAARAPYVMSILIGFINAKMSSLNQFHKKGELLSIYKMM